MDQSSIMSPDSKNPTFIPVQCVCGRALRAKADQVGTEIRCWDCRRMVLVSVPRDRQVISRDLSLGIRGVTRGRGLRYVLAGSLALTAALCIPWAGLLVAGLILTAGAALYGEVIRQVSPGGGLEARPTWGSILLPRSIVKPITCIAMAAGTLLPLWVGNAGLNRSPHWTLPWALVAGLAWTLLPILMLATYGADRQEGLGLWRSLRLLARHPFATLLAIAIIPATLVVTEVAGATFLYWQDYLAFTSMDLMPLSDRLEVKAGIPFLFAIDYRNYPQEMLLDGYFNGLRHGYSLSGAIPTSLSLPTRTGLNPDGFYSVRLYYDVLRVFLTLFTVTCLVAGFALQAMWIGAIAAVEKKRPA